MEIVNFILPLAHGGCLSRRRDAPPEPPPVLNLGPPPPVHWEETDSDSGSSESSFTKNLHLYVANNTAPELQEPLHRLIDDLDDDSYDDEQFEVPTAQSGDSNSMSKELKLLKRLLKSNLEESAGMSTKYFVIESLGIRIQYGELGIVVTRLVMDLKSANCLYQFVMAVFSFYKDLMSKTYLMVINQFGTFITRCLEYCFDFVVNCPNVLDMPAAQSSEDERFNSFIYRFRDCLTHYDRLVSSEFAHKVILFMSLITMSPFCVANNITFESFGVAELIEKTKYHKISKMSRPSFVYNILDCTCYMAEKLQYILMNGNLSCIYIDDVEVRKFEEEFSFLKYYEDKLNLLPNHEVTLDTYLKRVDALQGKLRDIKQFYSKDVAARYLLIDYRNGLARMKYAAMDKLKVSSERPLPIGLMLFGPPGIGKSVLADQILKLCYDNAIFLGHFPDGHVYDKKYKYVLCPEDEFMSEFRINHEVVMMDDVDQYTEKINEAKEGGLITKAISFVNEIPYVTPQAHLEDKGKIPLMAEFVIGTTNSRSAGIERVFKEHSGALRRFFFIDIEVREEFRRDGTTALGCKHDPKELLLHDFRLRRFEPVNTKYNEVYFDPDTKIWARNYPRAMNLKELAKVLREFVQKPHYRQATAARETVEEFLNSEMCKVCGITSLLCDCEPIAQSGELSRFLNVRMSYVHDSFLELLFLFYVGIQLLIYGVIAAVPYMLTVKRIYHVSGYWLYTLMNYTMVYPIDTNGLFRGPLDRIQMGVHFLYLYGCHSDKLFQAMDDVNKLQGILHRHKDKILVATGLGVLLLSFKLMKKLLDIVPIAQGGDYIKPSPDANQAKTNPWKVHITPLEKLPSDCSSTPLDVLIKTVDYNVCYLEYDLYVDHGKEIEIKTRFTNALGIYSNYLLAPKHWYDLVKESFPIKMMCVRSSVRNKISPNRSFYLDESCLVVANSDLDFVILFHGALGPFRDIRPFMSDTHINGKMKAVGLVRDDNGDVSVRKIEALCYQNFKYRFTTGVEKSVNGYCGESDIAYERGDCGSLVIAQAKNGYFLCSYHIAGMIHNKKNLCYSIPLLKHLFKNQFNTVIADCNSYNGIDLKQTYNTDRDLKVIPDVHAKCPSRMIDDGVGEVFGHLEIPRRKMKSTVCDTLFCERVLQHYGKFEKDYFSPKDISGREAVKIAMEQSMNQPYFVPFHLQNARLALACIYVRNIDKFGLYVPNKPFDLDVGINGCDGVTYIDRLPTSTSGGFAHKGPKLRHLVLLEPTKEHSVRYGFDAQLQKEYDDMLNHYKTSDDAYSIVWDFNLKDEPVSAEKIRLNKCRVFNAGPFVFNVLVRQYFLWCVPLFSGKHRHEFGMAIGANVLSEDWTVIYHWVTRFGVSNMIAGDYKAFDKNMPREVMLAAFQILFDIMHIYGWCVEDIRVAKRLASEIVSGLYNADGTLMRLAGNPSGNCLTTIINSMANIMYIMIACQTIEEELLQKKESFDMIDYFDFFDSVSLITYGDDNIMSSRHRHINHTSISQALKKFGLEYTMSDKVSESRPFIHISECDFLKRRFVPDVNFIGVVAAPLSEKSIVKSLTVCNKSGSVNFEEQCAQIIDSACREYYHYGEIDYGFKRDFFEELIEDFRLGAWLPRPELPTYLELQEDQLSKQLDYSFAVGLGLVPSPEAGKITLEKVASTLV